MGPQQPKPVNWRAWIIAAVVVLVVVVCLQNSQQVSFEVLFASFNAPLIVILAVFVLIGALIGYAAPILLRHRRTERAKARAIEPKGLDPKK
ncbi:MAG: LapA family protein [Solirubrobacterales bacterium]